jgi:hypothetical protein
MTNTTNDLTQDELRLNLIKEELVPTITKHVDELFTMAAKSPLFRDKLRLSGKATGMLRVLAAEEDNISKLETVEGASWFAFGLDVQANQEENTAISFGITYVADAVRGYLA